MRTPAILLVVPLLLGLSPGAGAREWRFSAGGGGAWTLDDGVFAVSGGRLNGQGGFSLETALRCDTLVGLSFAGTGGSAEDLHGTGRARFENTDLAVTGRFVPAVRPWLRPYVLGEVGASRGQVHLLDDAVSSSRWGLLAAGHAGLEVRTPGLDDGTKSVAVGVFGQAGWVWREDEEHAAGAVDLGTLQVSGPAFRFGVSLMW